MPFAVSCTQCGTRFALGAELYERKIKGRIVTVRCKQCKAEITVDGVERMSEPPEGPNARSVNQHPPVEGLWVVAYGADDDRELTLAQLERALVNREVAKDALVWREGMAEWLPLEKVSELTPLLKKARATPPPRKALPKPPQRQSEVGPFKSEGAGTLFVEEPPASSKTPALHDLTMVVGASKQLESAEQDIFGFGGGQSSALAPPTSSDLSMLAPPAEPEPEEEPEPERAAPAAPGVERSRDRATRPIWPWLVAGAAAAAAAGWLALRPTEPEARAPAEGPPAPVETAEPAPPEAPIATSAPAPIPAPPASAATEPRAPSRATAAKQPLTKAPTASDPAPKQPAARETTARPTEKELALAPPFDRNAALAALGAASGRAASCRKEGDPSGTATVVVTFAPSGRATSANVSGPPFAGTSTGGCIAAAMRSAKVPAFSGDKVTVSRTVVIN
jgi:hypothetical protein